VVLGDEKFTKEGSFIVSNASLEQNQLQADYNLMFQLATEHDGQMVTVREMGNLVKMIEENKQIATQITSHTALFDLINMKLVFAILLILLTLEWFLRKFWGLI